MEAGRPSQTAFIMAVLRARHYLTTQEPRLLDDSLAINLTGLRSAEEVELVASRFEDSLGKYSDPESARERVHAIAMGTCIRSRFVEDQLLASLPGGITQLVLLGAGLDTVAYRSPHITAQIDVFEVDFPATQAWKRRVLAASGVTIPDNVTFVPCDFERQTLVEALDEGGVRPDRKTFFTWLGVQPYLTPASVTSTLDVVATFPAGSELVMDLLTTAPASDGDLVREGSDRMLSSIGEPWQSWFEPEEFEGILKRRGYSNVEMVSFPEWLQRNGARFGHRFSSQPTPFVLISAKVA